jgi:hypothetical protein
MFACFLSGESPEISLAGDEIQLKINQVLDHEIIGIDLA